MKDDQELVVQADSESSSSSSSSSSSYSRERLRCFTKHGMVKLEDESMEHNVIKKAFFGSVGPFGHHHTKVVAIHKNLHSGLIGQARVGAFRIYSDAVAKKCGGDANIRFAWYGASRDEICKILSHGFCCKNKPENSNGLRYGVGVHLSPVNLSTNSVMSTMEDENGMRHMLLCRVILGNMEVVQPGSQQFQPSSDHFDSGVDDLLSPKTYIIWNSYMNSHIIPKYIISFKSVKGTSRIQNFPRSPYMNISSLLRALSNYLHPSKIALISKYHNDFLVNRITRDQLIRRLRQIAGDKLLKYVIKQTTNQK